MEDADILGLVASTNAVLAAHESLTKTLQLGRAEIVFSRLGGPIFGSGVGSNVGASLVYAPGVIDATAAVAVEADAATGKTELSLYECPNMPLKAKPRRSKRVELLHTRESADATSSSAGLRHRGAASAAQGEDNGGRGSEGARRTGVTARNPSEPRDTVLDTSDELSDDSDDEDDFAVKRTPASGADPLTWFGPNCSPSIGKAQVHFQSVLRAAISMANKRMELARRLQSMQAKTALGGVEGGATSKS